MTALFIVRATMVDPAVREDFDRWYQNEHLPDACKAFAINHAWRGWSDVESNTHYAFYEFETLESARAISDSDAIREMIAEFDKTWGDRVTRTREIVDVGQRLRV